MELKNREDIILVNVLNGGEDFSRKVLPFLQEGYFEDNSRKTIFRAIKNHLDNYNVIPSRDSLIIDIEDQSSSLSDDEFKETIEMAKEYAESDPEKDIKWLEDQTEKFCRDKSLYNAVLQTIQIIDKESDSNSNIRHLNEHSIPEMFQEALDISFDVNLGLKYTDTFEEQYEYYHQKLNKIPFEMDYLNKITNGGVNRKSLNIFLGTTGVGKTRWCCDLATQYAAQGYNVVYFTMEMAREEIRRMIDANLMDISVDDLETIPYKNYMKKAARVNEKITGEIYIEDFPTGHPHSGHFRYFLKELMTREGIHPDIVIVDYLGICSSSRMKKGAVNSYEYVKSISEEIRGLGIEFDCGIWTPFQLNREGSSSSMPDITDISESFGVNMSADFILGAISYEDLEKMDPPQIKIRQMKNRYGDINYMKEVNLGIDRSKSKYFELNSMGGNTNSVPVESSKNEESPPPARNKLKV